MEVLEGGHSLHRNFKGNLWCQNLEMLWMDGGELNVAITKSPPMTFRHFLEVCSICPIFSHNYNGKR